MLDRTLAQEIRACDGDGSREAKTAPEFSAEFLAFAEVVRHCAAESELVREWNRLTGHHLGESRTPIEIAIDNACEYDPDAESMPDFLQFVWDYIYKPLFG